MPMKEPDPYMDHEFDEVKEILLEVEDIDQVLEDVDGILIFFPFGDSS